MPGAGGTPGEDGRRGGEAPAGGDPATGDAAEAEDIDGILREAGLDGTVRAAGRDGAIASLAVDPADWLALDDELRGRIVARLKEAGYRYVAVEAGDPPEAG